MVNSTTCSYSHVVWDCDVLTLKNWEPFPSLLLRFVTSLVLCVLVHFLNNDMFMQSLAWFAFGIYYNSGRKKEAGGCGIVGEFVDIESKIRKKWARKKLVNESGTFHINAANEWTREQEKKSPERNKKKEVIGTLYEAKEKSYSLLDDHITSSIVNADLLDGTCGGTVRVFFSYGGFVGKVRYKHSSISGFIV